MFSRIFYCLLFTISINAFAQNTVQDRLDELDTLVTKLRSDKLSSRNLIGLDQIASFIKLAINHPDKNKPIDELRVMLNEIVSALPPELNYTPPQRALSWIEFEEYVWGIIYLKASMEDWKAEAPDEIGATSNLPLRYTPWDALPIFPAFIVVKDGYLGRAALFLGAAYGMAVYGVPQSFGFYKADGCDKNTVGFARHDLDHALMFFWSNEKFSTLVTNKALICLTMQMIRMLMNS